MDFQVFDQKKIESYAAEAREKWGKTEAYREYARKSADYTPEKQKELGGKLMELLAEFGRLQDKAPEDPAAQEQVEALKAYISENYYTCTNDILAGLGQMYAAGGEMTDNINAAGGAGTAEFAAKVIMEYCK